MSLSMLKEALVAVSEKTYHFHAPANAEPDYIVWAEDGSSDLIVDNKHLEYGTTGTIDLYTLQEDSPLFRQIQEALNGIPCAWYLNSTQYEEDTKLIHYEWVFEV